MPEQDFCMWEKTHPTHPKALVFHGNPTEEQKEFISDKLLHSLRYDMKKAGAPADVFYDVSIPNPTDATSKGFFVALLDRYVEKIADEKKGLARAARDYIAGLTIIEWYELKISALRSLGLFLNRMPFDLRKDDPEDWAATGARKLLEDIASRMIVYMENTVEPGYYVTFDYPGDPDEIQKEWAGTAVRVSNETAIRSDLTEKEIVLGILNAAAKKWTAEKAVQDIHSACDYINGLSEEEFDRLRKSAVCIMLGWTK